MKHRFVRVTSAIAFFVAGLSSVTARGAADAYPCHKQLASVLDRSEPPTGWAHDATAGVTRSASSVAGVRLEIRRSTGWVEFRRVGSTITRSYRFTSPSCLNEFRLEGEGASANKKWTDHDLSQTLKASAKNGKRGMIYVWSPNMPLALRGLPEARSIAKSLNMDFIAVRDPHSSAAFARQIVEKRAFPAYALRALESDEIFATGALDHFPSVVLFEGGRLHPRARPGYDEPAKLRAYLERSFSLGQNEGLRLPSGKAGQ